MKRVLPFGAAVFIVAGFGFLPMIGCFASSAPSDQEGQVADDVDVPLTPQAARMEGAERGACGVDGARCCTRPCCFDGSTCVYQRLRKVCMKNPPRGSRIVGGSCQAED